MLIAGKLPGTRECVVCCRETNKLVHAAVACGEKSAGAGGPSQAEMVGCLLTPFIGWFVALLLVLGLRSARQRSTDDVSVVVPLPACEQCQPALEDPAALAEAMKRIPEYAALLDRYPNARVTRRG